jgi:hypothetical protein
VERHALSSIATIAFGASLAFAITSHASADSARQTPLAASSGWRAAGLDGIRGITIGPIENAYHPGVGYGTRAFDRTLVESEAMGATWVAITPFGRVGDLEGRGVDPTFEAPFEKNQVDVARAIDMAHARGLHVMLVPHLWVESGEWRAQIDPKTDEGWARWAASYRAWVLSWAKIAEASHVEMFSCGVELRSWVTSSRAPSFAAIIHDIRKVFHGTLTYSANWDDAENTIILGDIDVIGINAFYPLADKDNAPDADLDEGGKRVREKVHALAEAWNKPVLFTEIGYTTRPNPAIHPWEWPDSMSHVVIDEDAQASAYAALIAPLLDEPDFAGFFVWRVYADPDDVSQEAAWGFSPRGKRAELVLRDAFNTSWAADGSGRVRWSIAAKYPGIWP